MGRIGSASRPGGAARVGAVGAARRAERRSAEPPRSEPQGAGTALVAVAAPAAAHPGEDVVYATPFLAHLFFGERRAAPRNPQILAFHAADAAYSATAGRLTALKPGFLIRREV